MSSIAHHTSIEQHHVFGRELDVTVPLPSEVHQELHRRERRAETGWPQECRRPEGRPLRRIARLLYTLTTLCDILGRCFSEAADWLLAVERVLDREMDGWEDRLPPYPLSQKGA